MSVRRDCLPAHPGELMRYDTRVLTLPGWVTFAYSHYFMQPISFPAKIEFMTARKCLGYFWPIGCKELFTVLLEP